MSERLVDLMHRAGGVGIALFVLSWLVWWMVMQRWLSLRDIERSVGVGGVAEPTAALHALGSSRLLHVLVAVAPMLGLLGTVSGMIDTFASLHTHTTHVDHSVANGISSALRTTQMGLLVGVPGLVAARMLDSKERRCRRRVEADTASGVAEAA